MASLPPLIAIAEGRKVRARKSPRYRPLESKLHAAVAKMLTAHCPPDWKWRFNDTRAGSARAGAIAKRMGANAGWPDFILISPYGSVRFLELKRAGGGLSEEQEDFRMWCVVHGVPHVVAHTIDDVGIACDAWGCLRIKFARVRPEAHHK